MTVSEAGLVFSFFALIMFLLSPAMGSIVSIHFFIILECFILTFNKVVPLDTLDSYGISILLYLACAYYLMSIEILYIFMNKC